MMGRVGRSEADGRNDELYDDDKLNDDDGYDDDDDAAWMLAKLVVLSTLRCHGFVRRWTRAAE